MATIINTPSAAPAPSDGGSGMMGILVGIVLVVVVVFLFFAYGLPVMRGTQNTNTGNGGPTINVPDKIQVEVKK